MNIFCLFSSKEAEESLMSKIKETNEMLKDLDGCITDLESGTGKKNYFHYAVRNFSLSLSLIRYTLTSHNIKNTSTSVLEIDVLESGKLGRNFQRRDDEHDDTVRVLA